MLRTQLHLCTSLKTRLLLLLFVRSALRPGWRRSGASYVVLESGTARPKQLQDELVPAGLVRYLALVAVVPLVRYFGSVQR